ncbi:helix-turn-helix domain-containing protein [uncultured Clostridium sp.]|uniref:helix-turn-helix domain-containing protein n=1 Tax=uncultured Clostridium sp. TaxID=59620 RepID=UPI00351D2EC1
MTKSKNISLADTLGYKLSKSSYYRYINGESDLNSRNFLDILDNLKISLEELTLISNNFNKVVSQFKIESA